MRMVRKTIPFLVAGALFLAGFCRVASAQQAQQGANPAGDPPGRVARIDVAQGSVSFLPAGGGDNDWIAASTNRPVTIGDKIWADNGARAELQIGSTAIQMDQNTGVSFLNLDDNTVQIQLTDGAIDIRLRELGQSETYEVDTPNIAFTLKEPGTYRVETNTDGNHSVVTVREGSGEVIGAGRSYNVIADQKATFDGTDTLEYDLADADAQPMDNFDQWSTNQDQREDNSKSTQYVSPDTTGYDDLDNYGTWVSTPDYGYVWVPTGVAVGWAPYRYGQWVWIAPWGWTWVDDEPWGFAPFHYGRWAYWNSEWVWVPGPLGPRPYYAPALVAWIGGGPGFGFSFSVGSFAIGGGVAWFPLGPREVFVPTYRVSAVYVTRVNVTNTVVDRTTVMNTYNNVNVRNVTYANQRVAGSVSAVSRNAFVNGQPVSRNLVQVPEREAMSAPVSRQNPATPVAASFRGGAAVTSVRPPAGIMSRQVVAIRTPPRPPQSLGGQGFRGGDRPPNTGANNPNDPRNNRPPNNTPQVKQAPPVRPPTAQEKAKEDAKQKAWENAHPRPKKGGGA
jgi:hypothetical protein